MDLKSPVEYKWLNVIEEFLHTFIFFVPAHVTSKNWMLIKIVDNNNNKLA